MDFFSACLAFHSLGVVKTVAFAPSALPSAAACALGGSRRTQRGAEADGGRSAQLRCRPGGRRKRVERLGGPPEEPLGGCWRWLAVVTCRTCAGVQHLVRT